MQEALLMDTARGDRYEVLYVLCLAAGLRQGKVLGLKWSDVDFETGSLYVFRQLQRVCRGGDRVRQAPTLRTEERVVPQVGLARRAVDALKEPAERQAKEVEATGEFYDNRGLFSSPSPAAPTLKTS